MRQIRPLCLASASPRRRELLARLGLELVWYAPMVEEIPFPGESPTDYVSRVAALKADSVRDRYPEHVILAGDTVVILAGEIMGKPADSAEAERMLTMLSGKTHLVKSAYTLLDAATGEQCGGSVDTRVSFRALPPAWIQWYSTLEEARDKAGAYGIQGIGGAMVSRIDGSYTNVVGFPVEEIVWILMDKGWVTL